MRISIGIFGISLRPPSFPRKCFLVSIACDEAVPDASPVAVTTLVGCWFASLALLRGILDRYESTFQINSSFSEQGRQRYESTEVSDGGSGWRNECKRVDAKWP